MNDYNIRDVSGALKFISGLHELHTVDGFGEMLPEWHDALIDSIDLIKGKVSEIPMYENYLKMAKICLDEMDILEFRKIKL